MARGVVIAGRIKRFRNTDGLIGSGTTEASARLRQATVVGSFDCAQDRLARAQLLRAEDVRLFQLGALRFAKQY